MIVLKATQDKVLAVLQSVSGIVERRHTLPILANVLIKKTGNAMQFTTSDLEIQIRTIAMDFWASLEHQLRYKGDTPVSDRLRQKLYECALESSALDVKMQEIYQELQGQSEENEHGTNLL